MTEQATAAFRCEPDEHHWVSSTVPSSELVPWVVQCSICHAYNGAEMDYAIRERAATPAPAEDWPCIADGCGCDPQRMRHPWCQREARFGRRGGET